MKPFVTRDVSFSAWVCKNIKEFSTTNNKKIACGSHCN